MRVVVLALLAGCGGPDFVSGAFLCGAEHECPPGFVCDEPTLTCVRPGTSAADASLADGEGDGGGDGGGGEDALADAPPGAFGALVPIAELNSAYDDDDPSLTADLLEIYFDSDRPDGLGGSDIYRAFRASPADVFGPPENVAALNSTLDETTAGVSLDGLTIYLSVDGDIHRAIRGSRDGEWTAPLPVPELNSGSGEGGTHTTSGDLFMILHSTRADGTSDLYTSTRGFAGDPWSTPAPIAELAGPTLDADPWISDDLLRIAFYSDRPGTLGDRDIWAARRTTPEGTFDAPTLLLSGPYREGDPWLSPDERTLFLASDASGSWDLYVANR